MEWFVGQKVLCIKDHAVNQNPLNVILPKKGQIYTIETITPLSEGLKLLNYNGIYPPNNSTLVCFTLVEINNILNPSPKFMEYYFQPLEEKELSILKEAIKKIPLSIQNENDLPITKKELEKN